MGRKKKEAIDYFPHMVKGGKTLDILEGDYGNNGYAFWFKLLEILGNTKYHFYDCNNISNWKWLITKTKLPEISVAEILNTLADLDAIDRELWSHKVIWSQNFVENISEVYRKRGTPLPTRPDPSYFCRRNTQISVISVADSSQPDTESTHSRVEYSRVNITTTTIGQDIPEIEVDGVGEILSFYCEKVGKLDIHCTAADTQVALNWINKQIPIEIIKQAITEKVAYAQEKDKQINSLSYFEGKVKDLLKEGAKKDGADTKHSEPDTSNYKYTEDKWSIPTD